MKTWSFWRQEFCWTSSQR